jgi:prefoldin subunit 5
MVNPTYDDVISEYKAHMEKLSEEIIMLRATIKAMTRALRAAQDALQELADTVEESIPETMGD